MIVIWYEFCSWYFNMISNIYNNPIYRQPCQFSTDTLVHRFVPIIKNEDRILVAMAIISFHASSSTLNQGKYVPNVAWITTPSSGHNCFSRMLLFFYVQFRVRLLDWWIVGITDASILHNSSYPVPYIITNSVSWSLMSLSHSLLHAVQLLTSNLWRMHHCHSSLL